MYRPDARGSSSRAPAFIFPRASPQVVITGNVVRIAVVDPLWQSGVPEATKMTDLSDVHQLMSDEVRQRPIRRPRAGPMAQSGGRPPCRFL